MLDSFGNPHAAHLAAAPVPHPSPPGSRSVPAWSSAACAGAGPARFPWTLARHPPGPLWFALLPRHSPPSPGSRLGPVPPVPVPGHCQPASVPVYSGPARFPCTLIIIESQEFPMYKEQDSYRDKELNLVVCNIHDLVGKKHSAR